MASEVQIVVTKTARDQLARLQLKYRGGSVATACTKIEQAIKKNPTGGSPIPRFNQFTVTVIPIRAIYTVANNIVTITEFGDANAP